MENYLGSEIRFVVIESRGYGWRVSSVMPLFATALLLGGVSNTVKSDPSDDREGAKLHYQAATTAIAKNDWSTAKTELIDAEVLAPNNALIHYDLALAFSHTGMNSTAKKQMDIALNLGLPEQQQAAGKALILKWSESVDGRAGADRSNERVETPKRKISHADTMEWLFANATQFGGTFRDSANNVSAIITYQLQAKSQCVIAVNFRWDAKPSVAGVATLDFSKLDPRAL